MSCVEHFRERSILVLGLGREGTSTLRYLRAHFPDKRIGVADRQPLESMDEGTRQAIQGDRNLDTYFGPDYISSASRYEVVFKSPGIYPSELQGVSEGREITSNAALFFECCPGTVVGVTGTKGKSTTTSLIYEVLKRGGGDVRLTGNIGIAPLSSLEGATAETLFVAELSSYQLMDVKRSPHIAVLQNIVPEHLDYHGSFEQYVAAKSTITRYQGEGDYLLYNASYPIPSEVARTSKAHTIPFSIERRPPPACFLDGDYLTVDLGSGEERVIRVEDVPLKGHFNMLNVMPSIIVGRLMGIAVDEIAAAIREFKPLEHRLEYAGTVNGVQYYNDSLATIPEAAAGAMDAFPGATFVLMAGGFDRGLDYTVLAHAILANKVRALLLFPTTGERIWETLVQQAEGRELPERIFVTGMQEAVAHAHRLAKPGDIVLMSPAAPSFGVFKDYRDRGQQFKQEVQGLLEDSTPRRQGAENAPSYSETRNEKREKSC